MKPILSIISALLKVGTSIYYRLPVSQAYKYDVKWTIIYYPF